jgi:hypothetical protein
MDMMWLIGHIPTLLAHHAEIFSLLLDQPSPLLQHYSTDTTLPHTLQEWTLAQLDDPQFTADLNPDTADTSEPGDTGLPSSESNVPFTARICTRTPSNFGVEVGGGCGCSRFVNDGLPEPGGFGFPGSLAGQKTAARNTTTISTATPMIAIATFREFDCWVTENSWA